MRTTRNATFAAVAASTVVLLTACGGGSSGGTESVKTKSSVDSALAAKVPAAIKSDGTIAVGTDTTYAPSEFLDTDGKTAIGFDIDLYRAVGEKLGLKTTFTTAPFPTLLQAVQSGKYEIGVSSFSVTSEREKQAVMVSYFNAGTQWATQKGNPSGIQPDNACGKKVAVQQGTVQVDDLQARSKKCKDAGKSGIKIDQYAAQDDATN